jgi:hypothetical protein
MNAHDRTRESGVPNEQYASRRRLLESHLARLDAAKHEVSRSRGRSPWLLVGLVFVVPAGMWWGSIGALGAFLTATAITFMGWYVAWAHHQEYASQHEAVRQQLADLEHAFANGPRAPTRWRVHGKRTQL